MNSEENEMQKDSLVEIQQMIAHCKLHLPLSLCFAATRGDKAFMCRLLK